jgi:hypothetical protein
VGEGDERKNRRCANSSHNRNNVGSSCSESFTMTTVKKAKTAFMYFQADTLSSIRSSMDGASMGDAMQEVSYIN